MGYRFTTGLLPVCRVGASIRFVPLHGMSSSEPVPHWVVLFVAVLGLWVVMAGGVLLIDGVFDRISNRR